MDFNFIDSNIKTRCCKVKYDGVLLSFNYEEAWLHVSELRALIEMIEAKDVKDLQVE